MSLKQRLQPLVELADQDILDLVEPEVMYALIDVALAADAGRRAWEATWASLGRPVEWSPESRALLDALDALEKSPLPPP